MALATEYCQELKVHFLEYLKVIRCVSILSTEYYRRVGNLFKYYYIKNLKSLFFFFLNSILFIFV